MSRTYFSLLVRDSKSSRWLIEFGSYEKGEVDDEREDHIVTYDRRRADTKVIKTTDEQKDIKRKVDSLNRC